MNPEFFKKIYLRLAERPKLVLVLITSAALTLGYLTQDNSQVAATSPLPEVDTLIPKGYVLVPISVQNFESLDSVFGTFGVVDLYDSNRRGNFRTGPQARAVKMLRAPKNPSQFGVLVPAEQAPNLIRFGGPFFVVIHNQEQTGPKFEKTFAKSRASIVYDEEKP